MMNDNAATHGQYLFLSKAQQSPSFSCDCVVVLRVSSFGALVEYGCEKKITQFSNLSASIVVGVPSGVTLKLRLLSFLFGSPFLWRYFSVVCPQCMLAL